MTEIKDIYSRITNQIIADLEQGVRPWLKPWSSEHAAGRITRPLRHNGIAYQGINVVMLWSAATAKGYACPLWLTFRQALELGGAVRKGETGELVVYANRAAGLMVQTFCEKNPAPPSAGRPSRTTSPISPHPPRRRFARTETQRLRARSSSRHGSGWRAHRSGSTTPQHLPPGSPPAPPSP